MTMSDFQRSLINATVFVAINDKGELVGTGTLRIIDGKERYGYNAFFGCPSDD